MRNVMLPLALDIPDGVFEIAIAAVFGLIWLVGQLMAAGSKKKKQEDEAKRRAEVRDRIRRGTPSGQTAGRSSSPPPMPGRSGQRPGPPPVSTEVRSRERSGDDAAASNYRNEEMEESLSRRRAERDARELEQRRESARIEQAERSRIAAADAEKLRAAARKVEAGKRQALQAREAADLAASQPRPGAAGSSGSTASIFASDLAASGLGAKNFPRTGQARPAAPLGRLLTAKSLRQQIIVAELLEKPLALRESGEHI